MSLQKIREELSPANNPTAQTELVLEYCNNDLEVAAFFVEWLKNGHNSTEAYLTIHPEVTRGSASVLGSRVLGKVNKIAIMEAYGLTPDFYFQQLHDGARAMQYNDFTGKEVPDHRTRKMYHDKLGQHLEYEKKDSTIQQNNIVIVSNDLSSKYQRITPEPKANIPQS